MIQTDNKLVMKRFSQSHQSYSEHALVQQHMAQDLVSLGRCALHHIHGNLTVLELGSGTGFLTKALLDTPHISHYIANDLYPQAKERFEQLLIQYPHISAEFIENDAQNIQLSESVDIIASNAMLQWISDPRQFLTQLSQQLKPGGIMLLSTLVSGNYREITQVTGEGLNYLTIEQWQDILGSLGNIVAQQHWQESLYFDSPHSVLKHMQLTGVNGLGTPQHWGKNQYQQFTHDYQQFFCEKGFPLTYQPSLFVLKKPR